MKKLKSLLIGLPVALLVAASVAAAVPVYAETGSSDNSGSDSFEQENETESSENESQEEAAKQARERARELKKQAEEARREAKKQAEELRKKGKELVEQAKQERKQKRTQEQRQKVCESRKNGIGKRVDAITAKAQRHLQRVNNVYDKAQTYKTEQNVTVENWDSLTADADAAKVKAEASVQALVSLEPSIDCTSETVADKLAAFKSAATQARDDLKDYRQSVKTVLRALQDAQEGEAE